jgi:hypothetical protein
MYGAHEEELMRSAVFWAGKTTRSQQSYDHNLDGKTTTRQFGNVLEPEELMPRHSGQARLLVRGKPGQMVELLEGTDFVKYLDELRDAAAGFRSSQPVADPAVPKQNGESVPADARIERGDHADLDVYVSTSILVQNSARSVLPFSRSW